MGSEKLLSLNEYQDLSRSTAVYKDNHTRGAGLTYTVLALCGESGELANKLKKHLRVGSTPDREVLMDELGDVLWYTAAIAYELGYELAEVAQFNLLKLAARKSQGRVTG